MAQAQNSIDALLNDISNLSQTDTDGLERLQNRAAKMTATALQMDGHPIHEYLEKLNTIIETKEWDESRLFNPRPNSSNPVLRALAPTQLLLCLTVNRPDAREEVARATGIDKYKINDIVNDGKARLPDDWSVQVWCIHLKEAVLGLRYHGFDYPFTLNERDLTVHSTLETVRLGNVLADFVRALMKHPGIWVKYADLVDKGFRKPRDKVYDLKEKLSVDILERRGKDEVRLKLSLDD